MKKITRRSFAALTSAGVLTYRSVVHGFKANAEVPASFAGDAHVSFPYGAHVYREPHLPLQQLRSDFPLLKRLGFNMIKIQEVWEHDEPREGEIDLSTVSQLVSDARQNGLQVYFGLTMEQAPEWFWKRFPDASLVYATGEPVGDPTPYNAPFDGKPGWCASHPGGRAAAIRFIQSLAREIGKYDNIIVWNAWQEIGQYRVGLCFCRYTLADFRAWLKARYRTLQSLNEAWKAAYDDWEEVHPPRIVTSVPATIDWRYFMDNVYVTEALKWRCEALRQSDQGHRPVLGHVAWPTIGSTRDWRYASEVDIFGGSCYPGQTFGYPNVWDFDSGSADQPLTEASQINHEVEDILMQFDCLRSAKADGQVWTAELQGGPYTGGLARLRTPTAGDIRRWVLSCVAAGSRGICFWNHRPEIFPGETYGFSLLDWGSDIPERAAEAGRIAKILNAHADLFARGENPRAAVALVLNEDLYHWAEGSYLLEEPPSRCKTHLEYTVRGIWKSLWHVGICASFIESDAIPTDASAIKAMILPFPIAMAPTEIEALRNYVRSGGVLISEACPGRFDQYGMGFADSPMAPGIQELFGAKHKELSLIREPAKGAKWTNWKYGPRDMLDYRELAAVGILAQHSVFPAFCLQTFELLTATPVLKYGEEITGCVNNYGKGKAYLIGTFLGHAGPAYNDWRNATFLSAILAHALVLPDRAGKLNRRRRIGKSESAWFLFNPTESAVEERIELEKFKTARDLLGEALSVNMTSVLVTVPPHDVRCILVEA